MPIAEVGVSILDLISTRAQSMVIFKPWTNIWPIEVFSCNKQEEICELWDISPFSLPVNVALCQQAVELQCGGVGDGGHTVRQLAGEGLVV